MGQTESDMNHDQADDPGGARAIEEVGHAVHQIAAVNHFFAEGCQGPCQCNEDQSHFQISIQVVKDFKVRLLVKKFYQQRLTDEQLETFQQDAGDDAQCDGGLPVAKTF